MNKLVTHQATTIALRYGVRTIPTVLIIKNGKEINRQVGLRPETECAALLDKLVNKDKTR